MRADVKQSHDSAILGRIVPRCSEPNTALPVPSKVFENARLMSLAWSALSDVIGLDAAIARATSALIDEQREDGHYAFDLEADAAIPAEYIMVRHFLGDLDPALERRCAQYLRRMQEPHGGWPMLAKGELSVSPSVKAYLAMRRTWSRPARPSWPGAAPCT